MRKSLAITALFLASAVSATAGAQETAVYGGARDQLTLILPVTASVSGHCGFANAGSPAADVDVGDIAAGFSHTLPFTLSCNSPVRLAVQSRNGALRAPDVPPAGYGASLDYMITVHAVGSRGVSVSASCAASALTSAATTACALRGPASSTQGLSLPDISLKEPGSYLQLSAPPASGPTPLMASSDYADSLVLTLSPSS
ncbi:hypothetical protein [Brevundimonas sp.]|uniref:hypothetical protein n=1 Tax=Brevundimonas sp. TaxID=1871086 RepID=UPI002D5AD07F|nr:hypothetical protein [Brevundimonas sp.]HYD26480.1 hypothetical protein [Brevundimonas sp.]